VHDPADSTGGTDDALVGEFVLDPSVTVATALVLENDFDFLANFLIA